jgi:hypothetical protein
MAASLRAVYRYSECSGANRSSCGRLLLALNRGVCVCEIKQTNPHHDNGTYALSRLEIVHTEHINEMQLFTSVITVTLPP